MQHRCFHSRPSIYRRSDHTRDQGAIARLFPDFNPIEYLWKKVKKMATHLKYFQDFTYLQAEVDKALLHFAQMPHEIMALMTCYCESLGALAA